MGLFLKSATDIRCLENIENIGMTLLKNKFKRYGLPVLYYQSFFFGLSTASFI